MKCRILRDFLASIHLNLYGINIYSNPAFIHFRKPSISLPKLHFLSSLTHLWSTNHQHHSFHGMFRNQYCLSPIPKVQYKLNQLWFFQNSWVMTCFYGLKLQVFLWKDFCILFYNMDQDALFFLRFQPGRILCMCMNTHYGNEYEPLLYALNTQIIYKRLLHFFQHLLYQ